MMKFTAPEMEIMWFSTEDVLTTSTMTTEGFFASTECEAELPLM